MTAINMKESKTKKKTKEEVLLDRVNQVYDVGKTLGILMGVVDGLKTTVNDYILSHQKEHRVARIISLLQTLIVVIMFSFLKWGS